MFKRNSRRLSLRLLNTGTLEMEMPALGCGQGQPSVGKKIWML